MELIDYITISFIFALGWYCGSKVATWIQLKVFQSILAELNISQADLIRVARKDAPQFIQEKLDELEDSQVDPTLDQIDIKVEKHSDTLYAFRKDNDQFLGQGSTKDELIEAMSHRLKNVRLTVVEGNEYMKSEA